MSKDKNLVNDEEEETEIDLTIIPSIKNLSPTKIANQFWCEMQLHLKLHLGMEPTEEMITGSEIHRNLEEELGPVVEVVVTTFEDNLIAYILQIYTKLQTLLNRNITRELPVIGKIQDIPCLGIIDQIEIEEAESDNKKMVITDYKTRKSKRAPSYEQKRRNRIQLQVYWHMIRDLREKKFTIEMFKEYFEVPEELVPSDELLQQLPDEHKEILEKSSPHQLLEKVFSIFKCLPSLSNELKAIYMHQIDQQVVFADRTYFHEESFEVDMEWAVGYWKGERTPNECPQQWMCKFCQFTDNCSYFLKRYLNKKETKNK